MLHFVRRPRFHVLIVPYLQPTHREIGRKGGLPLRMPSTHGGRTVSYIVCSCRTRLERFGRRGETVSGSGEYDPAELDGLDSGIAIVEGPGVLLQ